MKKILLVIIIVVTSLNGVLAKKRNFSCKFFNYQQNPDSNVPVKVCTKIPRDYIKKNSLTRRVVRSLQNSILEEISIQRVSKNIESYGPCESGDENESYQTMDDVLKGSSSPDYR